MIGAHILGIPVEENLPAIGAVGAAWLIVLPAVVRRYADELRRALRQRPRPRRSGPQ